MNFLWKKPYVDSNRADPGDRIITKWSDDEIPSHGDSAFIWELWS